MAQDKEQRQALMAAQPPELTPSAVTATSAKVAISHKLLARKHSSAAPATGDDADAGQQQMMPHASAQADSESSSAAERCRQRRRNQFDTSKEGDNAASAAQECVDKVEGGFFQISICQVSSVAGTTDASSAAPPVAPGSKSKRQAAGNRAGTARQAGKQADHSGQQRAVKVRACLSDMAGVELEELQPGCQYIIKARAGGWFEPGLVWPMAHVCTSIQTSSRQCSCMRRLRMLGFSIHGVAVKACCKICRWRWPLQLILLAWLHPAQACQAATPGQARRSGGPGGLSQPLPRPSRSAHNSLSQMLRLEASRCQRRSLAASRLPRRRGRQPHQQHQALAVAGAP